MYTIFTLADGNKRNRLIFFILIACDGETGEGLVSDFVRFELVSLELTA